MWNQYAVCQSIRQLSELNQRWTFEKGQFGYLQEQLQNNFVCISVIQEIFALGQKESMFATIYIGLRCLQGTICKTFLNI